MPADAHVHSEWSWDTSSGSMERTCEQAVRIGLPSVVFTDHLDFTSWRVEPGELGGAAHLEALVTPQGRLAPPPFDLEGYLDCVERCRSRFPTLRILTGVEFGEPHRHAGAARDVLDAARFDLVLGSLHALHVEYDDFEPPGLFRQWPAEEVMRQYLAEVARMIERTDAFDVLTHLTYPVRYWPQDAAPFTLPDFEDDFRHVLHLLAETGRALEINTTDRLDDRLLRWWREEGGRDVSFGSDAHEPGRVGHGFAEAAARADALGFGPGSPPRGLWSRSG